MNESLNWNQKYTNAERSNYGKEKGWMNEPIKHKCLTGKIKPSCLTPLAAASYYTDLNRVLWGWGGGGWRVRIVFTSTPCMYRLLAVDLSYSDSRSVGLGRAVSLQEPWTVKRVAHQTRSAAPRHVFKIQTNCFLCVYTHRRHHSASVRWAQQRLRTLFKFLPRHRAPSALFYIK